MIGIEVKVGTRKKVAKFFVNGPYERKGFKFIDSIVLFVRVKERFANATG